ncbi:MAG TPA: TRAP transporter large permease subunit, partial [Candidatus Scatomorpha gallistercoris]|nr:TRAP transporter large permease subunit [Candidatus Scatomorpha gallistercoris]
GVPLIGLVLTMLCCIVLGMGVPTTANYVIMATTCAPILTRLGVNEVAAHFFVFYFGIVADITPPVALAAYAGAAIAKSNPMKTGVQATKLAIGAFIVPYVFALNPQMLFIGATPWDIVLICITAVLGMFGVAVAMNGFLYVKLNPLYRILFMGGGLLLLIPGIWTDIAGLVILVVLTLLMRAKRSHMQKAA